jgi:hypothetical protein
MRHAVNYLLRLVDLHILFGTASVAPIFLLWGSPWCESATIVIGFGWVSISTLLAWHDGKISKESDVGSRSCAVARIAAYAAVNFVCVSALIGVVLGLLAIYHRL